MSNERLTRQELSSLLAHEAKGAAKALRQEVVRLSMPPPEPEITIAEAAAPGGELVQINLDALDDAISMLSDLQGTGKTKSTAARKGRIDLAALLVEAAPEARIAVEPGAGTEVLGDESDLRRIIQVLLSQSRPSGGAIRIHRQGEWVKVAVDLGPDVGSTDQTANRWLSRMALRHGGKVEFETGTQTLSLPAEGAAEQREVAALRDELEQAQQLGEAYARELAASFTADEPAEAPSSPVGGQPSNQARLAALASFSGALTKPLREVFGSLRNDVASAEVPHDDPLLRALNARVSAGYELVGELSRLAECAGDEEYAPVDVAATARSVCENAEGRAARHGVQLQVEAAESQWPLMGRSFELGLRALVDHAIAATPQGDSVRLSLKTGSELIVEVEDGGPVVPGNQSAALIENRIDPGSLGRPDGPALSIADAVAQAHGGQLELTETGPGRTCVRLRLPKRD